MTRIIFFTCILISHIAIAAFQDEGFVDAKVRSDYNSSTVSYGQCLFDFPEVTSTYQCQDLPPNELPTSWSQSNFYSENGGENSSSYWVLSHNNENAYSTDNTGPPNQSLPISVPGSGETFIFTTYKECEHCNEIPSPNKCSYQCENYYRAHIIVHSQNNPVPGGIPYLGIHAASNRGNNQNVAKVQGGWFFEPNSVTFNAKLFDYKAPNANTGIAAFYVYFFAKWLDPITNQNINRMLFINLAHTPNYSNVPNYSIFPKPPSNLIPINEAGLNLSWNWPVEQSFFYPGADFAYMNADHMQQYCGFSMPYFDLPYNSTTITPIEKTFFINLKDIYQCASDHNLFDTPMPANAIIDVNIAGWAGEVSGSDSSIWMAVSNMRTYTDTSSNFKNSDNEKVYLYPVLSDVNNDELLKLENILNSSLTKLEMIEKYNIDIEDRIGGNTIETDFYKSMKNSFDK